MYRRFNCCTFNHPCPIWCPSACNFRCRNEVVNPVLANSFGFFNNLAVGAVAPDTIIPLTLNQVGGSGIASNGAGAVTLAAGTYEVTYFANGTIPAGGTIDVNLELNGADVAGSAITQTGTAGDVVTLSQTVILTVPQTSTLELVNNGAEATTFTLASMVVRRL